MESFKHLYTKEERSTFKYWFVHWVAYQFVALKWGVWRPKYLLHDIEKPFLRLFLPYHKVQKIHRRNNNHHLTYKNRAKIDWMALCIDWEASYYSKKSQPYNAYSYCMKLLEERLEDYGYYIYNFILPTLKKVGADKPYIRDDSNE